MASSDYSSASLVPWQRTELDNERDYPYWYLYVASAPLALPLARLSIEQLATTGRFYWYVERLTLGERQIEHFRADIALTFALAERAAMLALADLLHPAPSFLPPSYPGRAFCGPQEGGK